MNTLMKRLLLSFALVLCFVSATQAGPNKFSGVVATPAPSPCASPTVHASTTVKIYTARTQTLATDIYQPNGTTPITTGQVTASSAGYFEFVGLSPRYDLEFVGVSSIKYPWPVSTGFYNVQNDFDAKGDSVTDDTQALRNAMYYMFIKSGGTLYFPHGDYLAATGSNPIRVYSGITIEGANGDQATSNSRIRITSANQSLFTILGCTHRVTMRNIRLMADHFSTPLAGTTGIKMEGEQPYSTDSLLFTNMSINGFENGITVNKGQNSGNYEKWECSNVQLDHVTINDADYAIYINSNNAGPWQINSTQIGARTDKYGIFLRRVGFMLIKSVMAGGPPTSEENYPEEDKAETFLTIGSFGSITILNSQCEGFRNSIRVFGDLAPTNLGEGNYGGLKYPLNIINSIFGARIRIGGDVYFNSSGNIYNSNTVEVADGVHAMIFSMGDYISDLTSNHLWCPSVGATAPQGIDPETNANIPANCRRQFNMGTTGRLVFQGGYTSWGQLPVQSGVPTITNPRVNIGRPPVLPARSGQTQTTDPVNMIRIPVPAARLSIFPDYDETDVPALRIGTKRSQSDPLPPYTSSNIDFFYDITRSVSGDSAGMLSFTGNQTDVNGNPAYVGYRFNNGNISFNANYTITLGTITQSQLSTTYSANGTLFYCSDCAQTSNCGTTGSGAIAKRINNGWQCN